MLRLCVNFGTEDCQKIGQRFVSDRLITLMDHVIQDYVCHADPSCTEQKTVDENEDKPRNETVDLRRLSGDKRFWLNCLVKNNLLPKPSRPRDSLHAFFSMYEMLKAENTYEPSMTMKYILYSLIRREQKYCENDPDHHTAVKRLPEHERSRMMDDLLKETEEYTKSEAFWDSDARELAEGMLAYYENMDMYIITCFEETDMELMDSIAREGFAHASAVNAPGENASGDQLATDMDSRCARLV